MYFKHYKNTWYKNYDWYSVEHWANEKSGEIWIRDNYGVEITDMDPGGAADQKLTTMILDDKYPYVIHVDRDHSLTRLIENGALIPIDNYMEKFPNLIKYLDEGTVNTMRASDGHMYGYPNWAVPVGQVNDNGGWRLQEKHWKKLCK